MALAATRKRSDKRGRPRLGSDERGATLLEFALLAPIFFAILAATLQTSLVFLSSQVLESAVHDASRTIRTGQAQQSSWSLVNFRDEMCARLYGLIDCAGLHIEVSVFDDFRSVDSEPPVDTTCEEECGWSREEAWSPGAASSIVLVQVHYKIPLILPMGPLSSTSLPDGRFLIGASAVFRNEPY